MGLLDPADIEELKRLAASFAPQPDSKTSLTPALLAAGLGILANPSRNAWESVGRGGLLGLQTYNEDRQRQQKDPMQQLAMMNSLIGLQGGIQNLKQGNARRDAYASLNGPQQSAPQMTEAPGESTTAFTGQIPQTPQQAPQQTPQAGNMTYNYLMKAATALQAKGLPEDAIKLMEQAEKFRPQIEKQTVLTDPKTGQRTVVNLFKDGTMEQVPYQPDKEKLSFHNIGGSTVGLDSFTGAPQTQYQNTATPGEKMTDTRSREQFDQQTKQFYDAQSGLDRRHNSSLGQADRHHLDTLNKPQILDTGNGFVAADPRAGTSRPIMGADGPVEKVRDAPSQYTEAFVKNEQMMNKIGTAQTLLAGGNVGDMKGDKKAIGPVMGNYPDTLNLIDKSGTATRAAVADIGSTQLFLRSGAAVTVGEWDRAKPFIPRITDTPEVAQTKLTYLRKIIGDETQALQASAKAAGYKIPKASQPERADPFSLRKKDNDPLGLR